MRVDLGSPQHSYCLNWYNNKLAAPEQNPESHLDEDGRDDGGGCNDGKDDGDDYDAGDNLGR